MGIMSASPVNAAHRACRGIRGVSGVSVLLLLFFCMATGLIRGNAAEPAAMEAIAGRFGQNALEFTRRYCMDCHSGERPKAKFDISVFQNAADVREGSGLWEIAVEMVESGEMPPEDEPQPSGAERQAMLEWSRLYFDAVAEADAGDPGLVLARRLTNAEWDNAIRDLTGVDIRPARDFPVDSANQAGFSNSGEALFMSPGLLRKYLEASREVADHMVLTPDGIEFAAHPVVSDTDRDKYCVLRIVDFYRSQPVEIGPYLLAAARFERDADMADPRPGSTASMAERNGLSPSYLERVHQLLTGPCADYGVVHELQKRWKALPLAGPATDRAARELGDWVLSLREKTRPQFGWLQTRGIHTGSQSFVLWRNNQYARTRHQFEPERFGALDGLLDLPPSPEDDTVFIEEFRRFSRVFPDRFLVMERGREYLQDGPSENEVRGRFLSAGFHNMMGFFRDDSPLYELILDEDQRAGLDRLWDEFEMIARIRERQFSGFLWFERAESGYMRDPVFDFIRPEDRNALSESMIQRLAGVYLAKAQSREAPPEAVAAIDMYFHDINQQIRNVEKARASAEPRQIEAAMDMASRAFRRPLTDRQRSRILGFYRSLRTDYGLEHEDAMRDLVVSILMAPEFNYIFLEPSEDGGIHPLNSFELATRLSFFLWSSLPDPPLLAAAADGTLLDRAVLLSHARRMMDDPRIRGLAEEFLATWLGVRRFQKHNAVDRDRFPSFTDSLRSAMYEEPVRFFIDAVQRDLPLTEFIHGDHTLVNPVLAGHYRMEYPGAGGGEWVRVPAGEAGRGGILPMAAFLTANSPGLRTSPVKRGHWVASRVLGEHIPAPPPDVPDLPEDESGLGDLTLAQALARHRDHPNCAACHQRFDALGLVFENFGPVGEFRTRDLGDRPVSTTVTFPDGSAGEGLEGLRHYLASSRRGEFENSFTRQLMAYALGRSLILSDGPVIRGILEDINGDGFKTRALIEQIILSPQFLNKRDADPVQESGRKPPGTSG